MHSDEAGNDSEQTSEKVEDEDNLSESQEESLEKQGADKILVQDSNEDAEKVQKEEENSTKNPIEYNCAVDKDDLDHGENKVDKKSDPSTGDVALTEAVNTPTLSDTAFQ